MICIECGGAVFSGGEVCDDCVDSHLLSGNVSLQSAAANAKICTVCTGNVLPNNSRTCANCGKHSHIACDSSEPGLEGFVCITCRRSPIVQDVMLGGMSNHEPISPLETAAPHFPPTAAATDFSAEIYHHPAIQQIVHQNSVHDEISDGDSARNSPFYPDTTDYDEDFVPSGSGRGRGRGSGNNGAKKKPGRGGGLLKRPMPSGPTFFGGAGGAPSSAPIQPTRGKRGKRGSSGKGRGRGRGRSVSTFNGSSSLANSTAQNFGYPPGLSAIREVDDSFMEVDESSRQSAATRADDAEYVRTIVVCNSNDPFLKKACLCLVCGAVGKGPEASMVSCSNCAQTYHTYCVGLHDKLNSTVVFRGWRCLDCTVCEGCGNGGDESKLLLCEECDISYHIYCLRPPLDRIPSGPWRCQWCARCRRCNTKVMSGNELTRDGMCHPCHSLRKCPKCAKGYGIGDKLIRCAQCNKWQHGHCENLFNDEMLEQAAANRMRCSNCRPNKSIINNGLGDGSNVVICDNVALFKHADEILKSKFMPSLVRPTYDNYRESFDHYGSIEDDYPDEIENFVVQRGRGRGNPGGRRGMNRIGIGGFFAKLPRHRVLALTEEAAALNNLDEEDTKKLKRPRKPRRSHLEDAYPPAIQEAFFGIKAVEGKSLVDLSVDEPMLSEYGNGKLGQTDGLGHELSTEATEMLINDINENEFLENMDLHDMDGDIDKVDLSLFFDYDDDEDFEDSLGGLENDQKDDLNDIKPFEPTSFPMDQPSSSSNNNPINPANSMYPNEANNYASNMQQVQRAQQVARTQSSSNSNNAPDAPERYQFSERWEEDEPLGLQATTAAVLYSNEKHQYLKENYPEWTDRVKQIQRLWRTLSADERQEYVNRARENRTTRGRNPRPRKQATTSNSMDSPNAQSPAPHQLGGFKVPQVPPPGTTFPPSNDDGPSSQHPQMMIAQSPQPLQYAQFPMGAPQAPQIPQPQKQYRITCHLSPEIHQQYRQMTEKQKDLEKVVSAMEGDLSKQRKQKKNLAAKKRALIKTAQAAPDYDGRVVDLNEADRGLLQHLTDSIKVLQGELDISRRDMKGNEALLREFEVKQAILRNESEVTPQMIEQTQIINQQAAAQDARMLHMRQQQQQQHQMMRMRGPPGHPGGPPGPQGPLGPPGPPPPYMRPQLTPQQHMEMQRRMHIQQQQRRAMRSSFMGGVRFEQIENPIDREVYEVLDDMLIHIVMSLEGPPRENQMLKQLLDPNVQRVQVQQQPMIVSPQMVPHPMMHQMPPPHPMQHPIVHQPLDLEGPTRPKKKRTVQKKPATNFPPGSEHEVWVEKMRARFRLCQEIPKRAKEPPLKNPGAAFATMGITEIHVRNDRRCLSGTGFGHMNLAYMDDYYTGDDRTCRVLASKLLGMHDILPTPNLVALYSQTQPECEEYLMDLLDKKSLNLQPLAIMSEWLNMKRGKIEHLRAQCRSFDVQPPIEPLRRMFYADSREEDIDVTITLRADAPILSETGTKIGDGGVAEVVDMLKEMLGVTGNVEVKIEDTPPMSPSVSPALAEEKEMEKEIKMEIDDDCENSNSSLGTSRFDIKNIKKEIVDPQIPSTSSQSFECKKCAKNINGNVSCVRQKMGKLGLLPNEATEEQQNETVVFCSMKCYYELMATSKMPLSHEEITAAESHVDEETFNRLKQIHSDNIVKAVSQGKSGKLPYAPTVSMEGLISPKDTRYMMDEGKREKIVMIHVSSLANTVEPKNEPPRVASDEWKIYSTQEQESFAKIIAQHQEYIMSSKMGVLIPPHELDQRQCVLCGSRGDGETSKCGRLLSLTEYFWVHVNCALWSTEVFENQTGGLVHVDRAVVRASKVLCAFCGRPGASIKCHKMDCQYNFHVLCAQSTNGYFIKDRTFICRKHELIAPEVTVQKLDALRRIYIQRDENELLARMFELSDGPKLCLRLGAFSFYNVGQLMPDQMKKFHNAGFIFPVGYKIRRWFWSPKSNKERVQYECTISDKNGRPWFTVKILENTEDGEISTICNEAESATQAWSPIFENVRQNRGTADMLRFFSSQIQGETLFGLNENVISKITESLPGVDSLYTYTFRHSNSPILDLPLAENPMGCARAEPRQRQHLKHHRTKPQSGGGGNSAAAEASGRMGRTRGVKASFADEQAAAQIKALGLSAEYAAMYLKGMEPIQGNQQIFSAYQKMRREWKNTVFLARSKIQGLGLYAKHDISMGDFIIEYKGEVIRSELGEVREKRYNSQNRGVYMFRIDEEWIIDATMAGGPARYINHSCDPNCSTRIVDSGNGPSEKKIIITANRPIMAEEELTYDYQFELEDSTDKIPCLCGAPNCVKWMN